MSQKSKITQWGTRTEETKIKNCYDEYCKIELDDHLYHSKDEMDAAIALLMLHYQDFQNEVPKNQILSPVLLRNHRFKAENYNEPNTSNSKNSTKKRKLKSKHNGNNKSKQNYRLMPYNIHNNDNNTSTTSVINDENIKKSRTATPMSKENLKNINKKTSTLLTSCRNILKEFLEQNGFQ